MNIDDRGQLVAGYGDWNSNSDSFGVLPWSRVGVVPLNLATGEWSSDIYYAGSEAMDVIRKFDGKLYIPTTDPSDRIAHGMSRNNESGYLTNETGQWRFVSNTTRDVHTFDVTKIGDGEFITVGSGSWNGTMPGVARAYITRDSGATWDWTTEDDSTPGDLTNWERYYWTATFGGKTYVQGEHIQPEQVGYQVFDGNEWTRSESTDRICATYTPKLAEVFNDELVCASWGGLTAFDGEVMRNVPFAGGSISDFYIDNEYLYALASNGIYRSSDIDAGWERVSRTMIPGWVSSLAVYDDYVYLGDGEGQIHRSTTTISDRLPLTPTLSSISPALMRLSGRTTNLVVNGNDFTSGATVSILGRVYQPTSATDTSVTVRLDAAQLLADVTSQIHDDELPTEQTEYRQALDVTVANGSGQATVAEGRLTVVYVLEAATSEPNPGPTPTPTAPTTPATPERPGAPSAPTDSS